jgi:threonine aldolase
MNPGPPADVEPTPAELHELRRSCARSLDWHGYRTPSDYLAEIPADTAADVYGHGGVVAELESEVASMLKKPAAVFMPSGMMAQQIALRVHADRRGRRTVLFHPMCHLETKELRAYERLHGLHGRPVGEPHRLLTLDDLRSERWVGDPMAELPAALLLELPQRDIGGQLPAWDDLVAQVDWAHSVGAAVHMDGARLWGCEDFYGRSLAEIAGLFDTVYVSFYKELGGLAGAAVAGPVELMDEVREWRRRHGGMLYGMWPNAASDLAALRLRYPRIPAYRRQALAIAAALHDLPGVQVVPDPPHTTMLHLLLHHDASSLRAAALGLAREDAIWTWSSFGATEVPGVQRVELEVGDATLAWQPHEVRSVVERLLRA